MSFDFIQGYMFCSNIAEENKVQTRFAFQLACLINVFIASRWFIWGKHVNIFYSVIFLSFWAEVHYNSVYPDGGEDSEGNYWAPS